MGGNRHYGNITICASGLEMKCPKCEKEGKIGELSCFRFDESADVWYEHCLNKECDYCLPHSRRRNMKVEVDRRKKC